MFDSITIEREYRTEKTICQSWLKNIVGAMHRQCSDVWRALAMVPRGVTEKPAMTTRIGVFGANGRMGRMVLKAVLDAGDAALVAAGVRAGSADLGADAGVLAGVAPRSEEHTSELQSLMRTSY